MNKVILPLLLCVPFVSSIAAEIDFNAISQDDDDEYIVALHELSPEIGTIISDISNVRKHNCNQTITIKRMKYILAFDSFVPDTLRKNAEDPSYLGSDTYRAALNDTFKHCK